MDSYMDDGIEWNMSHDHLDYIKKSPRGGMPRNKDTVALKNVQTVE